MKNCVQLVPLAMAAKIFACAAKVVPTVIQFPVDVSVNQDMSAQCATNVSIFV